MPTFALFHLVNELLCIIACRRVVRQPHAGRVVIFSTWPANMEVIAGHFGGLHHSICICLSPRGCRIASASLSHSAAISR